jgi:hypothetical protein
LDVREVEQAMTVRLAETRTTCRLCKSPALWKAVPLSPLPVASPNVGMSARIAETAPADLWQCRDCGFLQLATIVNPEFQYRNFQYFTGISVGLREHFGELIGGLAKSGDIGPGKLVVDIGSNDGSLLRFAKDLGARVVGIDPAEKIARAATEAGIPTIAEPTSSSRTTPSPTSTTSMISSAAWIRCCRRPGSSSSKPSTASTCSRRRCWTSSITSTSPISP